MQYNKKYNIMEYKEELISFNTIAICKKNIHRIYLTRDSNFEPMITFYLKDEDKSNNLSHSISFKNDFVAELKNLLTAANLFSISDNSFCN